MIVTPKGVLKIPGVRPGCVVCVKNGERGFLNYQIRYTQRIALKDLDVGLSPSDIRFFSAYTHIGVVTKYGIGEMNHPCAQLRSWEMLDGSELLIRKMPLVDTYQLQKVADFCLTDVANHEKYGTLDLLAFCLKWQFKRKKKFIEMFDDDDHDVCSTRAVEWHQKAGLWDKLNYDKWSYYPARLACSTRWEDVARVKINAST